MMSRPVAAELSRASTPHVKALWRGFLEYGGRFVNETFRTLKLASLSQKQAAQEEMFAKIDDLRLRAALGGGPGFEGGGGKDPVLKKEVRELLKQVGEVQQYLYRKKVLEKGKDDLGPHITKIAAAESAAEADAAAAEIRAVIYRMYRRSERRSANVVLATTAVVLLLSGLYYRYNMKQQITNLRQEALESKQKLNNAVINLKDTLKFTEKNQGEDFETWITRNFKKNEESLHKLQELIAKDGKMVNSVFINSFLTKLQDGFLKKMTQTVRANEAYIQVFNRNYDKIRAENKNLIVKIIIYGQDTQTPIMTYQYNYNLHSPTLKIKGFYKDDPASQVWRRQEREKNIPQPSSTTISGSSAAQIDEKSREASVENKEPQIDMSITSFPEEFGRQVTEAVEKYPLTTWDEEKGLLSLDSSEWIRTQCLQKMSNNNNLYYNGALFEDEFFNPKILFFDDEQFEKLIKEVNTVLSEKKNITEIDFHGLHVDIPSFHSTWRELVEEKKTYGRNPLYYPFEKVTDQKYLKTASDFDDEDKKTKLQEITGLVTETAQWPGENIARNIEKKWQELVEVLVPKSESKHVSKKFNLVTLDLSNTNIDEKSFNNIIEANHETLQVIKCDNVLRTIPLNLSIIAKCRHLSTLHCNYYLNLNNKETFYDTAMITSPLHGLGFARANINASDLKELSANWFSEGDGSKFLNAFLSGDGEFYDTKLEKLNGKKITKLIDERGKITGYRLESVEQVQVSSGAAAKKVCSRCGYPKRAPSSH